VWSGDATSRTIEEWHASGLPNVGEILKRLRKQRGLSLKQAAQAGNVSPSFLSAVERGESDIALQRLARLARVYDHDVGSLLGYSARQATPSFSRVADRESRVAVDRGEGIDYTVIRVPGTHFELVRAVFQPRTAFRDELTHEGVDMLYVFTGEVVLVYHGSDYLVGAGDCAVWSGSYPHAIRNDADSPAEILIAVTEVVY
jgi:transcriptional regulator with XRE-family HTH domain